MRARCQPGFTANMLRIKHHTESTALHGRIKAHQKFQDARSVSPNTREAQRGKNQFAKNHKGDEQCCMQVKHKGGW